MRKFILQERDRELEFKIQSLAHKKNIAAKPFILDSENELMICEFLEGEHKKSLSREELKKIVVILKKLHVIKIESEAIDLEALFTVQNREVKEAFAVLENYPKEMLLCHNDLNPKNIIFSNKNVKFIDWEFAGINDLYFDLACVSVEFDLNVVD
ncbi:MAG: choline/ethanolamine kinase family protein, partial [Campylobacterota bacterium]